MLPSLPTQSLIVRSFLEGNRSNYPCLEGEKSEKRQKMYKSMAFWSKTSTTRITIGQKKKSEHQETNVGQFLISRKGRFLISTQPMRCDLAPPELSQPPTCRLLPPPAASFYLLLSPAISFLSPAISLTCVGIISCFLLTFPDFLFPF